MTTRRMFLLGSAAVAGGVAIGFHDRWLERVPREINLAPGQTALTPYVIIDAQGITIITPRAEMGQGIHTTLAALVAEELDVSLELVRVAHGAASELYTNSVLHGTRRFEGWTNPLAATQGTGGQTSTRDAFVKMRKAGAAARSVLVQAAARQWGVNAESLTTRDGAVFDMAGQRLDYMELAAAAAAIEPPADPPLKPPAEWKLLGQSQARVDMPGKCTGTAQYAIDVPLDGMLFATVKRNPHRGGRMLGYDATRAEQMPGVERVVPMEDGVIVVATNTWYAFKAADTITFDWEPAAYPPTSDGHRQRVDGEFEREPYFTARDRGDVEAAIANATSLEGTYRVPYLAHATMEPLNATAHLRDGQLDIWAGNQNPTKARLIGATLAGLDKDAVNVHTTYMGGGFGRRFELDDVQAAVLAAVAVPGKPVRVTYSREEDFAQDRFRPMASAKFRAAVADGKPVALDLKVSAPSLFVSSKARQVVGNEHGRLPEEDRSIVMGARSQKYGFDNLRVTAYRPEDMLPVGWWRSVGESQNCFFYESIMDELAHAAGADPLEMRLGLLDHEPSRQVLASVAEMSNWGGAVPEGRSRGLAYALASGQATAQVIEISRGDDGIRLHRAWVAVDVGVALDPRNIEAQVQGAMVFGLSAAIYGEVTIADGIVQQSNFDSYRLLRLSQVPPIEVRVHESGERIKGVGEAGTPAAAPALGNAIFAATGQRVRELPFSKTLDFA
ncbi:MAG: molybdopterin cofactor-binding domain-containing protein [Pseudomonadota bacterium]